MSRRRSDLPKTVEACHQLILELYETIDELRARIAELERELYGTKRERFIADPWEDEASHGNASCHSHRSDASR